MREKLSAAVVEEPRPRPAVEEAACVKTAAGEERLEQLASEHPDQHVGPGTDAGDARPAHGDGERR